MTPLPSLVAWARAFAQSWNRFFFEPVDLRVCAAIRIAFAALLLVNFGLLGPDLFNWFGSTGLIRDLPLEEYLAPGSWSVLLWLPPTNSALVAAYAIALLQTLLLLLGLGTRLQAIGCFVWLVSFQVRNPMIWDGEDTLFRLLAALLIFMPCGARWSLDAWLAQRIRGQAPAPTAPAWALKLLQLQMAIIFFDAFFMKLQGAAWQDGTALFYVARLDEFFPRFPLPRAIFDSLWSIKLLTWGTLLIEFAVPLLVWFRETRRFALLLALAFHLSCDYSMHLFLFHWIMLTGWIAFLRPEDWEAFARNATPFVVPPSGGRMQPAEAGTTNEPALQTNPLPR
jgi:hypothetical protein